MPHVACRILNLDGIVGLSHHYAGLSQGNLASTRHGGRRSNPRAAALQGLEKMALVHDLGGLQGVLPPHQTPRLDVLRQLGFSGTPEHVLAACARTAPQLLRQVSSASAMWTANAATVSSSALCQDGRVHITPANLSTHFHRALETPFTSRVLQRIFPSSHFIHHPALPATPEYADEGAANHCSLQGMHGLPGFSIFVYGDAAGSAHHGGFPARQSLKSSQAIARQHGLDPEHTIFLQQRPEAIAAGAFHNDVVATSEGHFCLHHQQAFIEAPEVWERIKERFEGQGSPLCVVSVSSTRLPLDTAIQSYLFNSQLIAPAADAALKMIVPSDCVEEPLTRAYVQELQDDPTIPIDQIIPVDLHQSMRNGGGPACLRLRVPLSAEELATTHQGILFTPALHQALRNWIERHYREQLDAADLADPALYTEICTALDELTQILQLPCLYDFQRT